MTTKSDQAPPTEDQSELIAAMDLGSNSFHMVVARFIHGEVRVISKMGEKVQLGAGLDKDNCLTEEAQNRALDCLRRFAQPLKNIPDSCVRVVGTNTLRAAKNAQEFRAAARKVLGVPIEVIAGREEARLVYLGVSHTLADDSGRRLVVDIGGGSTEFIIGERFETKELESLHMGCVSYSRKYFPSGEITESAFDKAVNAASREILYIREQFNRLGWQEAVGSSGTFKSINNVLIDNEICDNSITRQGLAELRKRVIKSGNSSKLDALGVKKERQTTFVGGLAIVYACFNVLAIDEMHYSEGALREGVLYDLLGRIQHEDVRERTIQALAERYHVDQVHAQAVERNANLCLFQVKNQWGLVAPFYTDLLRWAARLHEIGLAISHSLYHKHGAYLIAYSDLPGFSTQVQKSLSLLVRGHRRKLSLDIFADLTRDEAEPLIRLCILLRLAVMLQHARSGEIVEQFNLNVEDNKLTIMFDSGWLKKNPLTLTDLEMETDFLTKIGYQLVVETM